jgi:hypothetical protein
MQIPGVLGHGRARGVGEKKEDDEGIWNRQRKRRRRTARRRWEREREQKLIAALRQGRLVGGHGCRGSR